AAAVVAVDPDIDAGAAAAGQPLAAGHRALTGGADLVALARGRAVAAVGVVAVGVDAGDPAQGEPGGALSGALPLDADRPADAGVVALPAVVEVRRQIHALVAAGVEPGRAVEQRVVVAATSDGDERDSNEAESSEHVPGSSRFHVNWPGRRGARSC